MPILLVKHITLAYLPIFNPILHGVFDQRNLSRGGQNAPYLVPKPKVMKTPNLAMRVVVDHNFFLKIGYE